MTDENKTAAVVTCAVTVRPQREIIVPHVTSLFPVDAATVEALKKSQGRLLVMFGDRASGELESTLVYGQVEALGQEPGGAFFARFQPEKRIKSEEVAGLGDGLAQVSLSDAPATAPTEAELATMETLARAFKQIAPLAYEGIPLQWALGKIDTAVRTPEIFSDILVLLMSGEPVFGLSNATAQELVQETNAAARLEVLGSVLAAAKLNAAAALIERAMKAHQQPQNTQKTPGKELVRVNSMDNNLANEQKEENEIDVLARRISDAGMTEEARTKCEKELKKLRSTNPQSPEYGKIMDYLDRLASLPWTKSSPLVTDLAVAQETLDAEHYGLDKVKERIIEQIAVQMQTGNVNGSIICLVGPPGVGKTSIGKSLAKATGREFVRLSLGGVNGESDIRGHRRTYVDSAPGRILDAMKEAGTVNPIILLDEVDKLGKESAQGNPAAALLEVLDPAQNNTFVDHYAGVKYDLSNVMFVCSANELSDIPGPLRDRMEIIEIDGYTAEEKIEIAKRHLVASSIKKAGIAEGALTVTDDAIAKLVDGYTREAGVRRLEQEVNNLVRKTTVKLVRGEAESVTITADNLEEFAGPEKVRHEPADPTPRVGHVNGLYVSGMGGGVLSIESVKIAESKGGAEIKATGQLADVMKESVSNAYDFVRANAAEFGIAPADYQQNFISIKAGDGATPKDGPSAGLAFTALIVSTLTGIPLRGDVAMTGEVGILGQAMPIGGVKQKLIGAHRAGIKKVLVPIDNARDLADVPESVKKDLEIVIVSNVREVLEHTLVRMPEPLVAATAEKAEAIDPAKLGAAVKLLADAFQQASAGTAAPVALPVPANANEKRGLFGRRRQKASVPGVA